MAMAMAAVHSYHPRLHPRSILDEPDPFVGPTTSFDDYLATFAANDDVVILDTDENPNADGGPDVDLQAALIADPDNVEAKAMLHARSQTLDKVCLPPSNRPGESDRLSAPYPTHVRLDKRR